MRLHSGDYAQALLVIDKALQTGINEVGILH